MLAPNETTTTAPSVNKFKLSWSWTSQFFQLPIEKRKVLSGECSLLASPDQTTQQCFLHFPTKSEHLPLISGSFSVLNGTGLVVRIKSGIPWDTIFSYMFIHTSSVLPWFIMVYKVYTIISYIYNYTYIYTYNYTHIYIYIQTHPRHIQTCSTYVPDF